eukprot:Hpha_TRINITY_DN19060_c0_g1::TRINITY_DN19060_c0_g1_i1::g.138274::m.138274
MVYSVLLFAALMVAVEAKKGKAKKAVPAWKKKVEEESVRLRLRCSACRMAVGDVGTHLRMLREMRGNNPTQGEIDTMFTDLCVNGETQFWALKWTDEGPAELGFKRRYDIHNDERRASEAQEALGLADPPTEEGAHKYSKGGYWGTDEQKEWAKRFYLAECDDTWRRLKDRVSDWARQEDAQPEYPEECPYDCPALPGTLPLPDIPEDPVEGEL